MKSLAGPRLCVEKVLRPRQRVLTISQRAREALVLRKTESKAGHI